MMYRLIANQVNNPTERQSPALRIEAVSINCLLAYASLLTNSNLLIVAESLTVQYVEYFLLLRLIMLIHLMRRNAQRITMITDGRGNVIAGGNEAWILKCFAFCHLAFRLRLPVAISLLFEAPIGGKSHISYTPYGSIHRTDSSGPDISKFKFTGQEEDKESGLMYYKARYYDPMVGRFLQADSVVMPESTFGMNRYMYVEGNPVRFGDRSGHRLTTPQAWTLLGALVAPQYGMSAEIGMGIGAAIGRKEHIREKKERGTPKALDETGRFIAGILQPIYRTYEFSRRTTTRTALRDGLDNDVKMAAIGYMINGEEGAQWGYLLGTLKNQQTYINRRKKLAQFYNVIDVAIDILSIFFPPEGDVLEALGSATVKKGTTTQLGGAENFNDSALDVCTVAAVAHLDKQQNDAVQTNQDNNCFFLAARTNR